MSRDDPEQSADQDPRDPGHPFSVWTCDDVPDYLAQKRHRQMAAETIRCHLRDLGFRIVRPVLSISSPEPDSDSKVEHLGKLTAQARPGEIILLFASEVDLSLLSGIICYLTRRGEQRRIPIPGQYQRRCGFGDVSFMTGRVTRLIRERNNSHHLSALVEQVLQDCCQGGTWQGRKAALVVDNYLIHSSMKSDRALERYPAT